MVPCCACGAEAALKEAVEQGVMMTEDGREVDNPLVCGTYHCAGGHATQAIYYYEDDGYLRVQEDPDFIIF